MFERYNERARRAIFFARWWALNRPAKTIDTRDLILGIVKEHAPTDSPYAQLRARKEDFIALFSDGIRLVAKPKAFDIPLTDSSKRALAYAAREADLDGRASIDPFHIFRGILCTGDETAQKLIALGYTLEAIREATRLVLPRLPDRPGKIPWRLRLSPKTRNRINWAITVACSIALVGMLLYLRSQN